MLPSAGPYSLTQWNRGQNAAAARNPNYRGPRASNFDTIEWTIGVTLANGVARVEADQSDITSVPPDQAAQLGAAYGPGSPAGEAGRQRFFASAQPVLWYLALNTSRPAFAAEWLRRAVGYALDRTHLASLHGPFGGSWTDQILPSGVTGFVDADVFPPTPDLETALDLAAQAGVTPENRIDVVMYTFDTSFGPAVANHVQSALAPLGIDVSIQTFSRVEQHQRVATLGEPFDIVLEGWGMDYDDPFNFLDPLLNGARITPANNTNVSYFDDPSFNARLDAAAATNGQARLETYAELDADLSATAAILPYVNTNSRTLLSDRIGCHTFSLVVRLALNELCIRP